MTIFWSVTQFYSLYMFYHIHTLEVKKFIHSFITDPNAVCSHYTHKQWQNAQKSEWASNFLYEDMLELTSWNILFDIQIAGIELFGSHESTAFCFICTVS